MVGSADRYRRQLIAGGSFKHLVAVILLQLSTSWEYGTDVQH